MTKTKNIIKTCDCFLDLCIGLTYSLFDYHNFRQKCYDVCEKRKYVFIYEARDNEHLDKKNCYNCCLLFILCEILVNLFGVAGMKEIFIECNCEHLRSYYSNSYNEFYFHSDNDKQNEELITNQFRHSFCFTELRL